jgi:tRNA1(Val) A37 N6-methylase TrmN6
LNLINEVYDKKESNFNFLDAGHSLYIKYKDRLLNFNLEEDEINLRTDDMKQIQCFPDGEKTRRLLEENKKALKNYAISLPFWFYKKNIAYFEEVKNFYLKKSLIPYSGELGLQRFTLNPDDATIL